MGHKESSVGKDVFLDQKHLTINGGFSFLNGFSWDSPAFGPWGFYLMCRLSTYLLKREQICGLETVPTRLVLKSSTAKELITVP